MGARRCSLGVGCAGSKVAFSGKTRDGDRWLRGTLCHGAWAVTRVKDCDLAAGFRRVAARRNAR
jgi:hypothetical protein